jgi:ammonia channel protein AmtB
VFVSDLVTFRRSVDSAWMVANAFLVMFMQCGFAILEAGNGRMNNVVSIIWKNFSDFMVCSFLYYIFGFSLAFGQGSNHQTGFASSNWESVTRTEQLAYFFFELSFANAASTSNLKSFLLVSDFCC